MNVAELRYAVTGTDGASTSGSCYATIEGALAEVRRCWDVDACEGRVREPVQIRTIRGRVVLSGSALTARVRADIEEH